MTTLQARASSRHRPTRSSALAAFTLVELLTVISIIALLLAILMPSLRGARDSAKDVNTKAIIKAIDGGLELFKGENELDYRSSGGYPSSHAGPDIYAQAPPTVDILYGAHWLPRMLLGKDSRGYVRRKDVPRDLLAKPEEWYEDPPDGYDKILPRLGPYIPPDGVKLVKTRELQGVPGSDTLMDPALEAPVIVDAFGRPILYYAANPFGKILAQPALGTYASDDSGQRTGIFVHEDNWGFTGKSDAHDDRGMNFTPREGHKIANFGLTTSATIDDDPYTFTYYILDHGIYSDTGDGDDNDRIVTPLRKNSYLLITTGRDGVYGTPDDVNNFTQR